MKTGDRNGCGGLHNNGCGGYHGNGCGGLVNKNPAASTKGAKTAGRQSTAVQRAWQAARAVLA